MITTNCIDDLETQIKFTIVIELYATNNCSLLNKVTIIEQEKKKKDIPREIEGFKKKKCKNHKHQEYNLSSTFFSINSDV